MVSDYSFEEIEDKWIDKWRSEEVFDVTKSSEKEPYFVNVAYPYPSGSMHVGHGRTYTLPDIIARYKRMNNYNVLFPMAWHVTGTPVIGISRRIREEDEDTIELYRDLYGVPEEKISDFKDPLEIVDYFSEEYKRAMTRLGYSIDWKREFRTVDDEYNSFISWQYRKLKEKDLIKKGSHPVKYCPNDENALGDHDLLEGEEAEIDDFYLIKFKLKNEETYLPCATLRPETVFGVTNLWIKPDGEYVKININNEEDWVVSEEAVDKLKQQGYEIRVIEKILGKELIGKETVSPFGKEVPTLKASFVDLDVATGVVMSVPAHAPYDYIALKELESYIEPIEVIETDRYNEIPAKEILEEYEITNQMDPALEKATEELYNKEFSDGKMKTETKKYASLGVPEARDEIGKDLIHENKAEKMYEFNQRPVICRCGTDAVVKLLEDQWFIDYSNKKWKQKTHEALEDIDLVPSDIKKDFDHSIDWLNEWACTRRVGLGTKLPWDKEWIIEPLSDSTIYMSYYTISNKLKEIDGELRDELFDYIFLGEGEINEISNKTDIEENEIRELKEEFEYWYPYDYRFSAKDLIPNHLTFQLFHHTTIFDEENWPEGISVLGMGLLEGEKMSSSKGHVVLLEEAIDRYGADTVRFFLAENAEPWQDFDWREKDVKSTQNKLMSFWRDIDKYLSFDEPKDELLLIDQWLLSKFNKKISRARESLESHQTRQALQNAFYLVKKDLKWYKKRTDLSRKGAKWCLNYVAKKWIKLLAPFIPFIAEEVWSNQGKGLIIEENYPKRDDEYINERIEVQEEVLKKVREDIKEIIDVTNKSPKKIYLYTPKKWKKTLLNKLMDIDELDRGKAMNELMKNKKFREKGETINNILGDIIDITRQYKEHKRHIKEIKLNKLLKETTEFLSNEFNAEIIINKEKEPSHDPENKSKDALPLRPAIYLE